MKMGILLWVVILLCYSPFISSRFIDFNQINGKLSETINVSVSRFNVTIIFYEYSNDHILKLTVNSFLKEKESISVYVRHDNTIIDTLDLSTNKQSSVKIDRSLCPFFNDVNYKRNVSLSLEISTNASIIKQVSIYVGQNNYFELEQGRIYNLSIYKNFPSYYLFKFDPNKTYFMEIISKDEYHCMIVSIQNAECPISFQRSLIETNSIAFQTVTVYGGITFQKNPKFPNNQLFVIFELLEKNSCGTQKPNNPMNSSDDTKKFDISFRNIDANYYIPVFGVIGFFLLFYIISPVIYLIYRLCCIKKYTIQVEELQHVCSSSIQGSLYGSLTEQADMQTMYSRRYSKTRQIPGSDNSSRIVSQNELNNATEASFDSLSDIFTDPNVFRLNKDVSLSDLTKKSPIVLKRKYVLYFWYLVVVSVFYSLPVVQLLIRYQENLDDTGNQDICFYNFRCTRPFKIFTAFNNIISNVGYVLLGLLFTFITWKRDQLYKAETEHNGVPQYFGLFYAMGISLAMEGIMSACYHICPSSNNFQFDTAYMYILACLCIIKLYQTRHPDINATAHSFFVTMALIIFIAVIGVVSKTLTFWIIFTLFYFIMCAALTCEVYYLGRWKFDVHIFRRIYLLINNDRWMFFIPTYKRRMIILLIFNVFNISMAIFGIVKQPFNFPSFFLAIFMVNLLSYFVFYVIMKIVHSESYNKVSMFYVIMAVIGWGAALYCFINHPTDWQLTPAKSRAENRECIFLNFYDIHDVWHMLSAISMFFSFMALQNMDTNLRFTEKNKIAVF